MGQKKYLVLVEEKENMTKGKIAVLVFFAGSFLIFSGFLFTEHKQKDKAGPKITMDSETIYVSIHDKEEELLGGVKAWDQKDGDVSSTLGVESISHFMQKNERTIRIVAFDSDCHVARAEREVIYTDYHSPVFDLSRPLRFPLSAADLTDGMTVKDCIDGDLSDQIHITFEDEMRNVPGEYQVVYQVTNEAGDVTRLPVTVELYDYSEEEERPKITLNTYLLHLKKGELLDPYRYLESVTVNGRVYKKEKAGTDGLSDSSQDILDPERISIENPVEQDVPGVYEVVYRVQDADGMDGHVRLIVCVEEDAIVDR